MYCESIGLPALLTGQALLGTAILDSVRCNMLVQLRRSAYTFVSWYVHLHTFLVRVCARRFLVIRLTAFAVLDF